MDLGRRCASYCRASRASAGPDSTRAGAGSEILSARDAPTGALTNMDCHQLLRLFAAALTVRCIGQLSNRSGIGTKVRLKTTGQPRWQLREISGGSGYGSQNAPYAYFGMGTATNIEIVRIEWPSGLVQELYAVAPKQLLAVTEPLVSISPARLT